MTETPSQTKDSFSSTISHTSDNTVNTNITASTKRPSLPMTETPSQTKDSFSDAKISNSSVKTATLAPYSTTAITTIMPTGISKAVTNKCRFPFMRVSPTDTQSVVSRLDQGREFIYVNIAYQYLRRVPSQKLAWIWVKVFNYQYDLKKFLAKKRWHIKTEIIWIGIKSLYRRRCRTTWRKKVTHAPKHQSTLTHF